MSKIVRTMAIPLILFVLIYGLYIIMHGHLTPGGGFQGGAIFASGIALLIVSFGSEHVHKILKGTPSLYLGMLRSADIHWLSVWGVSYSLLP